MKSTFMIKKFLLAALLLAGNDTFAQLTPLTIGTIPAGKSIVVQYSVTVNNPFTNSPSQVSNQATVSGTNFANAVSNTTITPVVIGAPSVTTYYPRTSATDLSQVSNWTDDVTGAAGTSPADFTSANQLFNVNNNITTATVAGVWTLSGGSNMIINNTNGMVISSAGSLVIGTGSTADFNSRNVVVQSISTGTGSIGKIDGTITNANNVTVERYISSLTPNPNRAYRLLGPSVNASISIHANWQEGATSNTNNPKPGYGTHITGTTVDQTNGFDATVTGQGSLFTYNQGTLIPLVAPSWVAAANTSTATLNGKIGYLLYVRGDRSIDLNSTSSPLPSTNTTLRATGSLLMGPQSFSSLPVNDFDLVTNPYASAIDWNSIYTNNSAGFSDYYTYWDPNIGSRGGYVTVKTNGAGNLPTVSPAASGNLNIQSGQAFFVKSTTGITLNIVESDKSTTNNIDVFRVTSAAQKFTASLYFTDAILGRRLADGVTALYDNSYNASVDGGDAVEIGNFDENIAIARGGKHLSIEERPIITATDTLPLFMNNMKQQAYEFEFNPGNLNPNMIAQLVDNYTGTKTFLNVTTTTVVPFTVISNAASSATDRFYVLFSPSGALPITLSSVKAFKQNLPNGQAGTGVKVEWTVKQEINMDRYEVEHSPNAQVFTKIASVNAANNNITSNYGIVDVNPNAGDNFYRIKMIDKSAKISYSEIVKVNLANGGVNMITVSPNPVNGNSITLQLINLAKGSYTITVSNKLGQQILSKTINHPGGSAIQNLMLSKMFTTGAYQLKLSGAAITVTRQVIKN